MKLTSLRVSGFRSIASCELPTCNSFNVLIGRNNSGKSNILTAIQALFGVLQGEQVVTLDPPIGKDIDFHQDSGAGAHTRPIEICGELALNEDERKKLIGEIIEYSPQTKNVADSLGDPLTMVVTVRIERTEPRIALISRIGLSYDVRGAREQRILLTVSSEAAQELAGRLLALRAARQDSETLQSVLRAIDESDWRRAREAGGASFINRYVRGMGVRELSAELARRLDVLLRQSDSYEEFVQNVRSSASHELASSKDVMNEALTTRVGTFAGDESTIPAYVGNVLGEFAKSRVLYLTDRREPIGREEAQRLLDLKVSRGGAQVLEGIKETVRGLLGVKIDAFQGTARSLGRAGERPAEMDVDNFLVEANGSGIREALRLVLDYELQRPRLLLVEEPEIHLHPALEINMMNYLKRISASCQVFLTTHSTNFIDTVDMKNTYLVNKPDSTRVQLMELDDAVATLPRELGIRLSSIFMFDRLVFVEGASDEAILRELASTLRLDLVQSNVGFVPMGGVRNVGQFAGEAILRVLTKRQIGVWIVVDRDERDDEEVVQLEEALADRAKMVVLGKREIENYLVNPRSISQFIALKRELGGPSGGDPPQEGELAAAIDGVAEELKPFAVLKRAHRAICRPIYPVPPRPGDADDVVVALTNELSRMEKRLATAKEKVRACHQDAIIQVEKGWNTSKLDIVPGAELIDRICQRFGVRYKKEQDAGRLASLVQASEIAKDLESLIREFTS